MAITLPVAEEQPQERRKFTRGEYYRLVELGLFENEQVELIGGEIITMVPIGPEHGESMTSVDGIMWRVFGLGYRVRVQLPLDLGDSQPQPNIAIVRGEPGDFKTAHPTTAVLVIEIAQTSLEYDRTTKGSLYARAGIPEYWIVNLIERVLEVYREPAVIESAPFGAAYQQRRVYLPNEEVSPLEKPEVKIKVSDLFV